MADWPAKKNAAFELQFPIYDADGDLVTGAADLDTEISQDGGTFADATNEAAEIATSSGCYKVTLTSGEMNVDRVMTITKTSTTGAKTAVNLMYTVTRQLVDLAFPVTSGRGLLVESDNVVHADLKEWLGVAPLALSSQRVQTEVGAMVANVLTAAAINADAFTAVKFAADVAEEIADQVWDEARAGHVGAGSFGQGVASVQGNVTGSVASVTGAVGSVTGAVGSVTGGVGGNVGGSVGSVAAGGIAATSFAAGAINAAAIANAAIDAATFAAGAIDAAALAADAGNEIADAILKRDIDQVEATAPKHSLTTAILKAVSRIVDDAGTLKTYRTDGSTLHMSQTITVNATADPIDELTVGA